jgi:2-polyprenyl-6-methoxyphenol hydroxylase-like FAD-dependent oxidoreductase
MCNLIETHHPELLEAFLEAGARRMNFADTLPPHLKSGYQPEPGDERLWVLLCRRATMETVIRRHVAALPDVTIRNHCRITGLTTRSTGSALTATGLELDDGSALASDAVVDASGRTTRFPGWLKDLGLNVREEKDDAEIVYYTRHYRLLPGEEEPPRGERAAAGDLGYLKFGVFPGDNGHFAVIVCLPVAERALLSTIRDPEGFDSVCRAIPGLEPWVNPAKSSPTTDSFGIGDIQAVWRHSLDEAGRPLLHNFFAIGDAALRTNPLYGRGCSLGVLHAQILSETLTSIADPDQRARVFAERTENELRPIFDASLSEDRRGIRRAAAVMADKSLDRPDSLKKYFALAFGDALGAASREQIDVLRGVMRTFHLLEKPGDFLKDSAIKRRIFRYMLRGRRRNASDRYVPGPDRRAMHELLGIAPSAAPAQK